MSEILNSVEPTTHQTAKNRRNVFIYSVLIALMTGFDANAVPMLRLQKLDKLTPADMTDVKVRGFYGKVKTVKIKDGNDGNIDIEFDQKGKIVKTDDNNSYRVTFGANNRKDVSDGETTISTQTAEYTYYDGAVAVFVPLSTGTYTVTGTTVNVRSGAGSSFAKLGTLSQNETVEVSEISIDNKELSRKSFKE